MLPDYLHMHLSNRRRSIGLIKGKMSQNRPTNWTSAQLSSKLTAYSADKTCRSGTTYTIETRGLEQEHETKYLWIPCKRFKENIPGTMFSPTTMLYIPTLKRVPLTWMNIRCQISLKTLNETTRHPTTLPLI